MMTVTHLVHFRYVELRGVLFQSDSLVAGLEVGHDLRQAPLHLLAADEAYHPGRLGFQGRVLLKVLPHGDSVVDSQMCEKLLFVIELGAAASCPIGHLTLVLAACEPGYHRRTSCASLLA